MRYQTRVSKVDVIGQIWQPGIGACAMSYDIPDSALAGIRKQGRGKYTRAAVEDWLSARTGGFQSVEDFRVTISDDKGRDFDSDFRKEESELTWNDCMFPDEG